MTARPFSSATPEGAERVLALAGLMSGPMVVLLALGLLYERLGSIPLVDGAISGVASAGRMIGGGGVDSIYGGDGDDLLAGGSGGDFLYDFGGNDRIFGDFQPEELALSPWLAALAGDDYIRDTGGNNFLVGNGGRDELLREGFDQVMQFVATGGYALAARGMKGQVEKM